MRIEVQSEARWQIAEIARYIAIDDPDAADSVVDAIVHTINAVAETPGMGSERTPLDRALKGLRSTPTSYRNYLVFWVVSGATVFIVGVYHGARDLDKLVGPIIR